MLGAKRGRVELEIAEVGGDLAGGLFQSGASGERGATLGAQAQQVVAAGRPALGQGSRL